MTAENILIIGGVATGPKTAARLMRQNPNANVTMIERDSILSYGACGLPYYVSGTFDDIDELINTPVGIPRNVMFFEKAKGFKVLTRTEALHIDRKNKSVTVKNLDTGDESELPYDKLVMATGGSPFRPPIPGINLKNVWFMTHPDHAVSLREAIKSQGLKRAVMVGAGFIGIEMAEALVEQGLEVTKIEMMPHIMPGLLDMDMATWASKHLKRNGINLVLGERVSGIGGTDKVESVITDKQEIPADIVIVAVGTRPNDKLARESGLSCMDRGGIIINEYCQTSDPDIYAGGDCALNNYAPGGVGNQLFVALGSTANKHGRVIADHIAGKPVSFPGITCTGIARAFDITISRTGLSVQQAKALNLDIETAIWSGPDKPHYMNGLPIVIKMIASKRDRRLLGVQMAGMGDVAKRTDAAASLIFMGATLDDVANVDFAYAPPFSPPIDPLATCAHLLTNKLDGLAKGIAPFEAKKRIEEKEKEIILLDVRTPDEFKTAQLPYDVVHIPLGQLRERIDEIPKDKDILAFCKVSMRGYEAQRILEGKGYDRVEFIEGGVVGWPFAVRIPE